LFIALGTFPSKYLTSNLNYYIGSLGGHLYSRLKEVNEFNNVDILFLGSSHACRSFDPRVFEENGFTSFNLGSSGQTPLQTEVLLNRYLKKLNPQLIIYEVYPKPFCYTGVEPAFDIISNDKNDLYSIDMALKINNFKVYNTLIYGLFRDFFNLNASFKEEKTKGDNTYISGGYVETKIAYYKNENIYTENKWGFNATQFKAFERIISIFNENNIDFILVIVPFPASLYNSYINNYEFDSIMNNYGKYYNYNEIMHLNDSLDFYDNNHLNQIGAEKLSRKLANDIKEQNLYKH
jgi:poly-D-alanine transfer protein DltD